MTMRRNCPTYGRVWTVIRKITKFPITKKNKTTPVNYTYGQQKKQSKI